MIYIAYIQTNIFAGLKWQTNGAKWSTKYTMLVNTIYAITILIFN